MHFTTKKQNFFNGFSDNKSAARNVVESNSKGSSQGAKLRANVAQNARHETHYDEEPSCSMVSFSFEAGNTNNGQKNEQK